MSNMYIMQDSKKIELEFSTYPDGTENLKAFELPSESKCYLTINVKEPNRDLFRIMLAREALDSLRIGNVVLNIPYLPHARADRVFKGYMVSPLMVFLEALDRLHFDEILVEDVHSKVAPNYTPSLTSTYQFPKFPKQLIVCAPDIGAWDRANEVALKNDNHFISCVKERDPVSGYPKIKSILNLPKDFKGQQVVLVDDICDGGSTFITLAKELKRLGFGKVHLFTSHGIYSKGLRVFDDILSSVNCNNIIGSYVNKQHLLDFNNRTDK